MLDWFTNYRTAYGYPARWALLAEVCWRMEHTRTPGPWYAWRKMCEHRGERRRDEARMSNAAAFFATMDDELAAAGLHLLGELAVRRQLDDRDRLLVASVVTELGAVRDGLRVAEAMARLRRFIAQLGLTIFDLPALSLGRQRPRRRGGAAATDADHGRDDELTTGARGSLTASPAPRPPRRPAWAAR